MEIERKYLISTPPDGFRAYPSHQIEQAYLCTDPVIRIRRQDNQYWLTYKSIGLLAREEYNFPISKTSYRHLLEKADGILLKKRRYLIPMADTGLTIELDIFSDDYEGLMLAEVEFPDEESARNFIPPAWFGRDVTFSGEYQNSRLSKREEQA